jgi:hypothetical protein
VLSRLFTLPPLVALRVTTFHVSTSSWLVVICWAQIGVDFDRASLPHAIDVGQRVFACRDESSTCRRADSQHLGDIVRWMRRYSKRGKREMDLADASLYWLAADTGLTEILTVDDSDFSRYRLLRGKAFTFL